MRAIGVGILIVVIATGCGLRYTTANYEKRLQRTVGLPLDLVVAVLGPPQGVYDLPGGGRIVEFVEANTYQSGGYSYSVPETTFHSGMFGGALYSGTSTGSVQRTAPIRTWTSVCRTRFVVDRNGIIQAWSWQGNACVAKPLPE